MRHGHITTETQRLIRNNTANVSRALRLQGLHGLDGDKARVLSVQEVIETYNDGISKEEIMAWVWYKRTQGIPMKGWEKYFFDKGKASGKTEVVARGGYAVYDVAGDEVRQTEDDETLGEYVKTSTDGSQVFFRTKEGDIMYVETDCATIVKNNFSADTAVLDRLVKKGFLFYHKGQLLPYPAYVYANSYEREQDLNRDHTAIVNTYGEAVYERQKKVIAETRPKPLSVITPDVSERPQISLVGDFARDVDGKYFRIDKLNDNCEVYIPSGSSLQDAFRRWVVENQSNKTYFDECSAWEMWKVYVEAVNTNSRAFRSMDDAQKKDLRARARNLGERLFAMFLHECLTFEDQQRLDIVWNSLYNAFPPLPYDRVPVGFTMSNKFKGCDLIVRPAQREGVAFLDMLGSGIIAFDVGVGKTITAIVELSSAITSGKCSRPLLVVPNSTYKNWLLEILGDDNNEGVLTGTGITVNDWYNLGGKYTKRIKPLPVPEHSITVVSYEGFRRIGVSDAVGDKLCDELAKMLFSDSDDERKRQKNREKVEKYVGYAQQNTIVDMDEAGFDYIVFDEAHNFKKVFTQVRKKKDDTTRRFHSSMGEPTPRAVKAFLFNLYVQRKFGRNVMLLTATPFTNSPLEVFSMLAHVALKALNEEGYGNINDFFHTFVKEDLDYGTVDAAGNITPKETVRTFRNRIVLQRLIYNHINFKTGEEAGVKRPVKINIPRTSAEVDGKMRRLTTDEQIVSYLTPTERQSNNQAAIKGMIEMGQHIAGKSGDPSDLFRGMARSLANAFSPFLYEQTPPSEVTPKEFVEESPKIKYACDCIRGVKKYHEMRGEACSGQVIYSNRGVEWFSHIKRYLIEEVGFKGEGEMYFDVKDKTLTKAQRDFAELYPNARFSEVEIVAGNENDDPESKQQVIDAFNLGLVKVIIGSATIREGVNLQRRGTCLYNLYPEWNPTDIQQLEGRIYRQGNAYQFVRIAMPLIQDSMDVFIFQKLQEKTSRINDIWSKGARGNVLDVESLDPEEVKYALMTDVVAIAKSIIDTEKKKQKMKVDGLDYKLKLLRDFIHGDYEGYLGRRREAIQFIQGRCADIERGNLDNVTEKIGKVEDKEWKGKATKIVDGLLKFRGNYAAVGEETEDKTLLNAMREWGYLNISSLMPSWSDKEESKKRDVYNSLYAYLTHSIYSTLGEYVKKKVKAEETLLTPNGWSISDNLEERLDEAEKIWEKEDELLRHMSSEEYLQEKVVEATDRKKQMAVLGGSAEARSKDFSKTNCVLSYPYCASYAFNGHIPTTDYKQTAAAPKTGKERNKEKEKAKIRIRMRMRKRSAGMGGIGRRWRL